MPTPIPPPKFLFCESEDIDPDVIVGYVLHTHEPALLIRFTEQNDGTITGEPAQWFTDQATFINAQLEAGIEPAATLARLMRQASEFFTEPL